MDPRLLGTFGIPEPASQLFLALCAFDLFFRIPLRQERIVCHRESISFRSIPVESSLHTF
jgi:hypothetical protein